MKLQSPKSHFGGIFHERAPLKMRQYNCVLKFKTVYLEVILWGHFVKQPLGRCFWGYFGKPCPNNEESYLYTKIWISLL